MFRMTVQDVFSIKGRGTVATGQIESGAIRVGDEVRIDDGRNVTVTGVEMFRKVLDEAKAGDNVGLLLKDVEQNDITRGSVLSGPGFGGRTTGAEDLGLT